MGIIGQRPNLLAATTYMVIVLLGSAQSHWQSTAIKKELGAAQQMPEKLFYGLLPTGLDYAQQYIWQPVCLNKCGQMMASFSVVTSPTLDSHY